MGVVLALMLLQLVKLCINGFAVAAQASKETLGPINHGESWGSNAPSLPSDPDGLAISPSPANSHVYPSPTETPGSSHQRDSWRTISPSSAAVPNGSFFHSPNTLPPSASTPTPPKSKDIEPSISPSSSPIALSPPYEVVPSPSTVQGNMPPSVKSSPPQSKAPFVRPPFSTPTALAPVGIPSDRSKNSPVSQPVEHGNLAPNIDDRNANKSHTAEPVSPAPVATPSTNFPQNSSRSRPTEHGSFPPKEGINKGQRPESVLPASVPSPISTPSRIINPEKGGAPAAAPLYKTPKPLPAAIHSPAQAPAAQKPRQSHHAPEPLTSSPKSPSNKQNHSPALAPSISFYKHHHPRNIVNIPAPASSHMVSPPASRHQDRAIPPSLSPTGGQIHHVPLPLNSVPYFPPKESPSGSSSKSPKTPLLPQVQALPPPPPNEDCLSTVCTEPYVASPPGAPCRCVWPMRVGLRLGVSLYTFFPLVLELASEIATGVFMKKIQVRIMGANAANQQPDKTVVLFDLVPLGEKFDYTTAFLTSDRFWHKKVVIKPSYFGEYEVLYVNYPGLPPSPPLPPSSITMIDGGPYSTDGNDGRTIKPLGVDIQKRQHRGELSSGIIAIVAVSVFLAVVLCTAAAWVMFKFRDHVSQPASIPRLSPPSLTKAPGTATRSLVGDGGVGSVSSSFQSSIAAFTGSAKTFSMNDIEKATDNFHASRILGEGGFGLVYSGVIGEGTKVAVKVLKREDHQGDLEFLAEVEMLSRLHHRNLVKLIGICAENSCRCLVYELIPNGSLESHLHAVDMEKCTLDWSARMKIALGAARGLAYLHEDSSPRVIHRDFKSSNILLEDDFTPKVSDFGLARNTTDEENKHISTRVMGTFGYVAPEYAMTGHLLVKSDVYSYGVVLLELLTGRKPVDMSQAPGQENLVAWARPLLTSKEGLEAIIDPSLGADVPFDSVAKVAAIASMCVQPVVSNRPFMSEVVQALKLVCNECEEAKEDAGSRSSSQEEDLTVVLDVGTSNVCGQVPDNFQSQFSATTNFGVDIEKGLSASELFSSSASIGRVESGSFRRNSYSGPLGSGRSRQLWQIMRKLSGGSVSEHGTIFS